MPKLVQGVMAKASSTSNMARVPTDIIIQKNSVPYATSGFLRESHTPTPVPHAMVAVVFVAPIQIILPETTTHPKRTEHSKRHRISSLRMH